MNKDALGFKVCSELVYPCGIKADEWNYYIIVDSNLMPKDWDEYSLEEKHIYLNEDVNCFWRKGWIELPVDENGNDMQIPDDEAGEQTDTTVIVEEW